MVLHSKAMSSCFFKTSLELYNGSSNIKKQVCEVGSLLSLRLTSWVVVLDIELVLSKRSSGGGDIGSWLGFALGLVANVCVVIVVVV